jgi:hypothetical protein
MLAVFICGLVGSASLRAQDLPAKLHTTIDKTLDDQFSDIEKALVQDGRLDQKSVVLITVPLENYIEDVLFRINRPAVIYPRTIYGFIISQFKLGKTRDEIETLLVDMQKHNRFARLYADGNQS